MTTWLESLLFKLEPTKPSEIGRLILLGMKHLPAKSAVFRIQLLCTENRRYQKNTSLICSKVDIHIVDLISEGVFRPPFELCLS